MTGHRRPAAKRVDSRALVTVLAQVACVAALVGLWQQASSGSAHLYIGSPGGVLDQLYQWLILGRRIPDIATTVSEALLGLVVGVTVAVVLASLLAAFEPLAVFVQPFVQAFQAIPQIVLAPVFIVVLGIGLLARTYFVAAVVFFIPFHAVFFGLRGIDRAYIDNARMLGAGRIALVRDIYAPALVGIVITSLRLAAAWALVAALVSESIVATNGIGLVIAGATKLLASDVVVAGVLMLATVAFLIDRLLILVERPFVTWRLL